MADTIKFTRSGGIAGQVRGCEVEAQELPKAAARSLEKLVTDARPEHVDGKPSAARDTMQYEIEIDRGKAGSRKLVFDEMSMPQEAEPLVKYLESKSGWRRPE